MLHSSPRGAALKILSRLEGGAEAIILNDFHFLRAHMLPKQINIYLCSPVNDRHKIIRPPSLCRARFYSGPIPWPKSVVGIGSLGAGIFTPGRLLISLLYLSICGRCCSSPLVVGRQVLNLLFDLPIYIILGITLICLSITRDHDRLNLGPWWVCEWFNSITLGVDNVAPRAFNSVDKECCFKI